MPCQSLPPSTTSLKQRGVTWAWTSMMLGNRGSQSVHEVCQPGHPLVLGHLAESLHGLRVLLAGDQLLGRRAVGAPDVDNAVEIGCQRSDVLADDDLLHLRQALERLDALEGGIPGCVVGFVGPDEHGGVFV